MTPGTSIAWTLTTRKGLHRGLVLGPCELHGAACEVVRVRREDGHVEDVNIRFVVRTKP